MEQRLPLKACSSGGPFLCRIMWESEGPSHGFDLALSQSPTTSACLFQTIETKHI